MADAAVDYGMTVAGHDFGGRTPYAVQVRTMALMVGSHRAYVINGLGTGKTFCTLGAFDILRKLGEASRLLVLAPLSTLRFVWAAEALKAFPHLKVEVLMGTKEQRLKALRRDADVYVINHDGLATILEELTWRRDLDCVAIDELALYRNGGAKRTKTLREFVKSRKYAWGLTGAPMPRAVTDVWGQCSILTPHTVPKYFNALRQMLCYKAGPFKWEPRDGALERAVAMMSPSVRFSLDDVTELPPQVMSYVPTDMGAKQAELYNAMRRKAVAMIGGDTIDALNAGAVLQKLLQIALGWVYTRDGRTVALDNAARIQAIVDNVEATANKAIVFLPYKSALEGVGKAMGDAGVSYVTVSGDTPPKARNYAFDQFQNHPEPKVLLAHPACLAHGLTLTAADTAIWAGPVTSLEIFQQACGRIRRIGQTKKQYIVMLGGTPVEKRMYALLGDNELAQNRFLELLAEAA
jgi:SNF2 family DNA or RNA helicase